ncbi:hypothetical protein GCM10017600_57880 [Streptosporangium carneum]|uniref:Uncharacterized protein n=1 Tax=Streptosporangium carneum TaxID=47481 RepID=A0A9W6I642_9ACTN|nr:hypothetical protein GCM10017600_57880 [Streptosporangium carneum]
MIPEADHFLGAKRGVVHDGEERHEPGAATELVPHSNQQCPRLSVVDDAAAVYLIRHHGCLINMLVGAPQRITEYAKKGFAVEQPYPDEVRTAFERLMEAGYTSRLI